MARDIESPERSLCAVAHIVGPSMVINNPKRNVIGLRIISPGSWKRDGNLTSGPSTEIANQGYTSEYAKRQRFVPSSLLARRIH
jgi:hypothetical protein